MVRFKIFLKQLLIFFVYIIYNVKSESSIPKIFPTTEDSTVTPPRFLSLGCQGTERVTWTLPDNSRFWINKNFDTRIINMETEVEEVLPKYYTRTEDQINITYTNITESGKKSYGALLILENVTYNDIGYYYCHEIGASIYDLTRSKNIFVFVREKNKLSFLDKNKKYIVNAREYENSTLPCIPTSPNITVKLFTDSQFPVEVKDIATYNSHTGYNIRTSKIESQTYICRFQNFDEFELLHMHIRLNNFYDYNVKPFINSSDYIIKNSNDNLQLNCTIVTDFKNNSGLIWVYPKNVKSKINITTKTIPVLRGQFFLSTLSIKNLSQTDSGKYICKLNTTDKNDNNINKKYVIVAPDNLYFKPKIIPNQNEYEIISNNDLILHCEGSKNLTWSFSNHTLTKNKINTIRENGKYISTLTIQKAFYYNTGFYYCYNNDSEKNNLNNSAKIFVYVKDSEHLSANPNSVLFIKGVEFSNKILPCLPTSPDIEVFLINTTSFQKRPENFIPHVGFKMFFTQDDIINDLACVFKRKNITQQVNLSIDIRNTYKYEFEPRLSTSDNVVSFTGGDLILTCAVIVRPSFYPNIKWAVPNQPHFFKNHSFDLTNSTYSITNAKLVVSTLIVRNVKLGEYREYECSLLDIDNKTRSAQQIFTINVQFDIKPIIETEHITSVGEDLVMECAVRTDHNIRFIMNWTTPNVTQEGRIIIKDSNVTTDVYGISGNRSLIITNIQKSDEGNYTCIVEDYKKRSKNETVSITVNDPQIPAFLELHHMNNTSEEIKSGTAYDMKCSYDTDLRPKSEISWYKDFKPIGKNGSQEYSIPYAQKNDSGFYSCNVTNKLGSISKWLNLKVTSEEDSDKGTKILVGVVSLLVISFLLLFLVFARRMWRERLFQKNLKSAGLVNFEEGQIQSLNPNISISNQAELLPYDKKWEIPRDRIKLGKQLGSGEFGVVVKGEVFGIFAGDVVKTVAVKMMHRNADFEYIKALISELKIMTYIGKNLNVVNLLGACTKNIRKREILIVVEFCKFGNLRNFLLKHRDTFVNQIDPVTDKINCNKKDYDSSELFQSDNDKQDDTSASTYTDKSNEGLIKKKKLKLDVMFKNKEKLCEKETEEEINKNICTQDLICWSFQIARGMDYLSSRKILHGDLAARNVLLSDDNVVKICDFGLSKNMYKNQSYKKKGKGPLPIKWMAIESIRDRVFSTQTDVWSFGIVLWELFSLGKIPYPEMETDTEFLEHLSNGYRMEQPEFSTNNIYNIMKNCWDSDASQRPTFSDLVETIGSLLQENVRQHYIDLNQPYVNMNITEGQVDYLTLISDPPEETLSNNEENTNDNSAPEFEVRKRVKLNVEVD